MSFDEMWESIVLRQPEIEGESKKVVMTPKQFKLMLRQLYDAGYKAGHRDGVDLIIKSSGEENK